MMRDVDLDDSLQEAWDKTTDRGTGGIRKEWLWRIGIFRKSCGG